MRDAPLGLCEAESPSRIDPELFFAKDHTLESQTAKKLCGRCPLQERCLNYALNNGVTDGIWGGLTAEDRQKVWDQWPDGRPTHFDRTYHRQVGLLRHERRIAEGMTA